MRGKCGGRDSKTMRSRAGEPPLDRKYCWYDCRICRPQIYAGQKTPRMLNELIEKIEVHQAEKVDGVWQQKLTIHYHCVGVVSIPRAPPLPMPDIAMNTRKGVYASYIPAEKAG